MSQQLDCLIVGAGFSGLYMLHRARSLGLSVKAVETAPNVGGTWFWNRYPGASCDVDVIDYSFSFDKNLQNEWTWKTRFASQKDLFQYLLHVTDRFNLRSDLIFNTSVTAASWNEQEARWNVTCNTGASFSVKFLVMATGCLSAPKEIDIAGSTSFKGETYTTSAWPAHDLDFTGKRVAVIGTGSSGVQTIPEVAKQAKHVYVYQRTACYAVPAGNRTFTEEEIKTTKDQYDQLRAGMRNTFFGVATYPIVTTAFATVSAEERQKIYEKAWTEGGWNMLMCFVDNLVNKEANDAVSEFVKNKIRSQIKNPQTAEDLVPTDYGFGLKRACLENGYYEAFNRPNVSLINLRKTPIVEITPTGIKTSAGEQELDCIIYAMGFDAFTGPLTRINIQGRNNETVKNHWSQSTSSYLGLALNNFPNLFTICGPGSPSVLSNMVLSIEEHVNWVTNCLAYLQKNNIKTIEATRQAEDEWTGLVNIIANMTLFPTAKNSWYNNANIAGKNQNFTPYVAGVGPYSQKITAVAAANYEGFVLTN